MSQPAGIHITIEEALETEGVYVGPPCGVSMLPVLRNRKDIIVVVPAKEHLKKYDVALYRRGDDYVLHRVVGEFEAGYVICGDNCAGLEYIPYGNVIGVLKEFYRGERHVVCEESKSYQRYSHAWVALFPARKAWKRVRAYGGAAKRKLFGK